MSQAHLSAHPWCEVCGGLAEMVHHRVEHRGNAELMWDADNLASLCHRCHRVHHAVGGVGVRREVR